MFFSILFYILNTRGKFLVRKTCLQCARIKLIFITQNWQNTIQFAFFSVVIAQFNLPLQKFSNHICTIQKNWITILKRHSLFYFILTYVYVLLYNIIMVLRSSDANIIMNKKVYQFIPIINSIHTWRII